MESPEKQPQIEPKADGQAEARKRERLEIRRRSAILAALATRKLGVAVCPVCGRDCEQRHHLVKHLDRAHWVALLAMDATRFEV